MLIFGILGGFMFSYALVLPFLLADASSSADLHTIYSILGLIRALIPLMVFVLMYPTGRKIDLKSKLVPLIINLISGLYIGEIIGFNVVLIFTGNFTVDTIIPSLVQSISLFFVAFTALAISYLRHNQQNSIKQ
jgi:hypothetical protein